MITAIDATPMEADHGTSPSIRSDPGSSETTKSESTQPSPIDSCDPSNSSPKTNQPHTNAFAKYLNPEHNSVLTLKHAIATTLFNSCPSTLNSFIDPTVSTFKAVFKGETQLLIWRKGNACFIGIFEHHTSMRKYGFAHLVGVSIGWDGSWRVIVGAGNAFCDAKWPVVWSGPYEGLGGVYEMVVDGESMEEAKGERAARLAGAVMEGRFWERAGAVKVT